MAAHTDPGLFTAKFLSQTSGLEVLDVPWPHIRSRASSQQFPEGERRLVGHWGSATNWFQLGTLVHFISKWSKNGSPSYNVTTYYIIYYVPTFKFWLVRYLLGLGLSVFRGFEPCHSQRYQVLIFSADLLERWTHGAVCSCRHRVRAAAAGRLSLVYETWCWRPTKARLMKSNECEILNIYVLHCIKEYIVFTNRFCRNQQHMLHVES